MPGSKTRPTIPAPISMQAYLYASGSTKESVLWQTSEIKQMGRKIQDVNQEVDSLAGDLRKLLASNFLKDSAKLLA